MNHKDYAEYTVEDFLADPSFLNFCLAKNEEDTRFWQSWIAANPEKAPDINQARELFYSLNGNITPQQLSADFEFFRQRLEDHIDGRPVRTKGRRPGIIRMALAAAIAASLFFIWFVWDKPADLPAKSSITGGGKEITETTRPGSRKRIELPDGSIVTLNAGSEMKVAAGFNEHDRRINLQGEAHFDVAHNAAKPFIIHTDVMDIKVLGTVFNVKAYPGDETAETSLIRGLVEVTLLQQAGKKLLLRPNEKIVIEPVPTDNISLAEPLQQANYELRSVRYDAADSAMLETSWMENRLVFDNSSFEQVARELERWYGVDIRFENNDVRTYHFTAIFENNNIKEVLDVLQLSRYFEYTIREKEIIIKSR